MSITSSGQCCRLITVRKASIIVFVTFYASLSLSASAYGDRTKSVTEGTANFLVNRRMNKSQRMRWSRDGADLLLQVRCAVYNGMLGAGFGHRFDRISNGDLTFAKAA